MPDDFIPRFSDEYHPEKDAQPQSAAADPPSQEPAMSWSPMKPGGSNFATHRLKEVSTTKMAFRPTIGAQLFGGAFLVIGLAILGFGFYGTFIGSDGMEGSWILLIFGLIFGATGFFMVRSLNRPIVFDKSRSLFWRSEEPTTAGPDPHGDDWTRLDHIIGLQILAEHISGSESSYHSYELNLVLDNGKRIHVVDHGNAERMRQDTEKLSYFLGVPIYDHR